MGCTSSSNTPNLKANDHAKDANDKTAIERFVTSEEKTIIRESWAIVALDLPATGLHVFTRLFEMEKDLKKLFRRLMTQNESGDYIFDPIRLERHATMVMKSLGEAVENMDDSAFFSQVLQDLGQRHINYNVKPEMLPFLWPAIRDAFKMRLGDKFTLEGELAWKHLFDYIVCHIAIGIEQAMSQQAKSK